MKKIILILILFWTGYVNAQDSLRVWILNPTTFQGEWKMIAAPKDRIGGKDGYTPIKGKDYFDGYTPKKGIDYFDGKDGYTPIKGLDYFDGKNGKDGVNGKDGISVSIQPVNFTVGLLSSQFGAKGDGVTDDHNALQAMIDSAENHRINKIILAPGHYINSRPLNTHPDATGQLKIWISGAGTSYTGTQGDTWIQYTGRDSFCLNIQKGKGCVIENIMFTGQNFQPDNISISDISNPDVNYVSEGLSDRTTDPYTGLAIDYLPTADKGGSSDITIRNCTFNYFVDNIAISPNGRSQNAEVITLHQIHSERCKNSLSIGNSQTRTIDVNGWYCWGNTWCVFNGMRGYQFSTMPKATNVNIAGGVKYYCKISGWLDRFVSENVHAELLWSVGGFFGASYGNIVFQNSHIELIPTGSDNGFIERARVAVSCSVFTLENSYFFYLNPPHYNIPMIVDANTINIIGDNTLNNPVVPINQNANVNYFGNEIPRSGVDWTQPKDLGVQLSVTPAYGYTFQDNMYKGRGYQTIYATNFITYTGYSKGTANIHVADWLTTRVSVGDYLFGSVYEDKTKDPLGRNTFIIGCVTSINTDGSGTISGMPYGLPVSGTFAGTTLFFDKIYLNGPCVGDIQAGSNTITNVKPQSGNIIGLQAGDRIGKYFNPGVYVKSINGNTITMSEAATGSENNYLFK